MDSQELRELRTALLSEANRYRGLAEDCEERARHASRLITEIELLENNARVLLKGYDRIFYKYSEYFNLDSIIKYKNFYPPKEKVPNIFR